MIHDLVQLAKSVGCPDTVIRHCEKLTRYYVPVKYPVENRALPDESAVAEAIGEAEEVLEWSKSALK